MNATSINPSSRQPVAGRATAFAALAGVALLAGAAPSAQAAAIFTEEFTANASNWKIDSAGTTNADWNNAGGAGTAGYISRPVTTAGVIFRGQGGFDSSGDGFVRNWISEGVATFSIAIQHTSNSPVEFNIRFATAANSPGASTTNFTVAPGGWQTITIPIIDSVSPSPPAPADPTKVFQTYGGGSFNAIFGAVSNVQLSLVTAGSFTVGIDSVSINAVPEVSSAFLGLLGLTGLVRRRRR